MLQCILVTNLTTAPPVTYTLSLCVLNRKSLKKTLTKILSISTNGKLIDYAGFVHVQVGCYLTVSEEKQSLRNICYIWMSPVLGTTIAPLPPSTVRPSVLSVLSLIVKIKSEIWSKQQKPFVMRNSFCWATQVFKEPCQIVWQPYTVAKLNKEKLSELYHSLCRGRQEMTRNPAAWNLRSWHLILVKPPVV